MSKQQFGHFSDVIFDEKSLNLTMRSLKPSFTTHLAFLLNECKYDMKITSLGSYT